MLRFDEEWALVGKHNWTKGAGPMSNKQGLFIFLSVSLCLWR